MGASASFVEIEFKPGKRGRLAADLILELQPAARDTDALESSEQTILIGCRIEHPAQGFGEWTHSSQLSRLT